MGVIQIVLGFAFTHKFVLLDKRTKEETKSATGGPLPAPLIPK